MCNNMLSTIYFDYSLEGTDASETTGHSWYFSVHELNRSVNTMHFDSQCSVFVKSKHCHQLSISLRGKGRERE